MLFCTDDFNITKQNNALRLVSEHYDCAINDLTIELNKRFYIRGLLQSDILIPSQIINNRTFITVRKHYDTYKAVACNIAIDKK